MKTPIFLIDSTTSELAKSWLGKYCPLCISKEQLLWDADLVRGKWFFRRKCLKGHSVEVSTEVYEQLRKGK